MGRRWLSSRWLWLVACIVVGSLACTIPALRGVHLANQIAEAFSSGIRDGLAEAGFQGSGTESRRSSVSFLFGLVKIEDTAHPYLWSVIGGIVTGGGLGLIVWGVIQASLSAWRRRERQATGPHVESGSAPDRDPM